MHAQRSFKQGATSDNVATLLAHLQCADPGSPDIDEDNVCLGWGHDQFTAGGITPTSCLTSWQNVGSIDTAFKLVAAGLKTCQEARCYAQTGRLSRLEVSWSGVGSVLSALATCDADMW
jgi:hypothetical protein